jgi:hypothetical protein
MGKNTAEARTCDDVILFLVGLESSEAELITSYTEQWPKYLHLSTQRYGHGWERSFDLQNVP